MALQDDLHNNRGQFISDSRTAKGHPTNPRAQFATVWGSFKNTVATMKATASSEGNAHAEVLLASLERELQEAKDDITANPDDWDDFRITHFRRRVLHLLLGVNPYTTDPGLWEPE